MKKWLIPMAALAAVAVFSRLPHPARDIADLKPVRAVYIHMEGRNFHVQTDAGDSGSGPDLTEACADLRAKADGEIFLDTAEFLILAPEVPITGGIFDLLRPDCRVTFTDAPPDLEKAAAYLSQHPPKLTLARLRAA
jgi:hypothetical protein